MDAASINESALGHASVFPPPPHGFSTAARAPTAPSAGQVASSYGDLATETRRAHPPPAGPGLAAVFFGDHPTRPFYPPQRPVPASGQLHFPTDLSSLMGGDIHLRQGSCKQSFAGDASGAPFDHSKRSACSLLEGQFSQKDTRSILLSALVTLQNDDPGERPLLQQTADMPVYSEAGSVMPEPSASEMDKRSPGAFLIPSGCPSRPFESQAPAPLPGTHPPEKSQPRKAAMQYRTGKASFALCPEARVMHQSSSHAVDAADKKYKCEFVGCSYATSYLKDLHRHFRIHTGERPFTCKQCGKSFTRSDKLKIHERNHSGEKPYKCTLCPYATTAQSNLKKHAKTHSDERPFTAHALQPPVQPSPAQDKANVFGMGCPQLHPLQEANGIPQAYDPTPHPLPVRPKATQPCSKTDGAEKKYKCEFGGCCYTTSYLKDLHRHFRTHTGERPFACKHCGRSFTRSDKLKIHERGHSGPLGDQENQKQQARGSSEERPFKCRTCPYASRTSSRLIVHLRKHTGDTRLYCSVCGITFQVAADLKRHMQMHTGEKPYKCDLCTYRFAAPGNLKIHKRVNHGNMKVCAKCTFTTSSRKAMQVHARKHNIKMFGCPQCSFACRTRTTLKNHMRLHGRVRAVSCPLACRKSRHDRQYAFLRFCYLALSPLCII